MTPPVPAEIDQPRARPREALFYVLAFVTYVAASIWQKFLLNWVVGPLWLIAWVEIGTRIRRRRAATRAARVSAPEAV